MPNRRRPYYPEEEYAMRRAPRQGQERYYPEEFDRHDRAPRDQHDPHEQPDDRPHYGYERPVQRHVADVPCPRNDDRPRAFDERRDPRDYGRGDDDRDWQQERYRTRGDHHGEEGHEPEQYSRRNTQYREQYRDARAYPGEREVEAGERDERYGRDPRFYGNEQPRGK